MRIVRCLTGLLLVAAGTAAAVASPAPVAAASRGSVLMVGDSTMRGMSTTAQAVIRTGYDLAFDSGSCRRLIVTSCKPIPNAISVIRANPGMDAIVIMTGYNDWKVGDAVDVIMAEAARQGVSYVVWLTYRTDIVEGAQKPIAISQVFREHNQELAAKAPLHPRLRVLDWDGYSAGHNDWFAWDGFHLANPGGFALANLLKATLDGLPLGRCKPTAAIGTPTAPPVVLPPSSAPPAGLSTGPERRLLDTRAGDADAVVAPLGAGRYVQLGLTGSGVVAAGTTSVLVNLAAVDPCGSGYLTAYPCGATPLASNVNFTTGRTVANLAAVRLDGSGQLCIYASNQTDVLVDLVGSFGSGGLRYNAVPPTRLIDSRDARSAAIPHIGRLPVLTPLAVPVRGRAGVPADAQAVAVNVTAVDPLAPGYLTAFPCGPVPGVSSLNFGTGQVVANLAVVRPAADGTVCFVANASTHLVLDVVGWWGDSGDRFSASTPQRLLDSRDGGAPPQPQGAVVSVPAGEGKLLNVTAVGPATFGYLTAYPCGPRPWVSTLNYVPGQIVPNLAPVAPGGNDRACVFLQQAGHVVIDQLGTFVD